VWSTAEVVQAIAARAAERDVSPENEKGAPAATERPSDFNGPLQTDRNLEELPWIYPPTGWRRKLASPPTRKRPGLTKPPSGGHLRQWKALGMSRATWYRRGKPTKKPEPKTTQKDAAEILGVSLRTVQRDLAEGREKQRKINVARVREYMAQGYSQDEACELTAAELRAGAIEKLISEGRLVGFAQASQEAATLSQSRDNGAEAPARRPADAQVPS
jgi:uncharacterized protein YoaH (UPF0181 family)